MITLITGGPGTGKTAWLLNQLLELRKLEPNRLLFIHGIRSLRGIAHETLYCRSQLCDICRAQDSDIQERMKTVNPPKFVEDWPKWKESGALIIVDEVQRIWRPTNGSSGPSEAISALETHRHYGLDFWLISQGPHLFHNFIRLLVGRHVHLVAKWSGRKEYEWPECKQDVQSRNDAVERPYTLPKRVFKLYDSAEIHTQQNKRRPIAFYILILLALLFLILSYFAYARFSRLTTTPVNSNVPQQSPMPVKTSSETGYVGAGGLNTVVPDDSPFTGYNWRLAGVTVALKASSESKNPISLYFIIKNDVEEIFINTSGLSGYGYNIKVIDTCHVQVFYRNQKPFHVYCKKEKENIQMALPSGETMLAKH
ncbi:zonular occludens toxin domain-containing protein [Methylobacter sp.]|uniref:zonular occludens toxin domain-containing protein n=1 Tax=Methylobacter sp. TaxID=2051955 RepID=UPI002FDEB508